MTEKAPAGYQGPSTNRRPDEQSHSTAVDGRIRLWIAVDVFLAHSPFGQKMLARFGTRGLLAWICVHLEAKRNPNQGTFTYTTDRDFWERIGLPYEEYRQLILPLGIEPPSDFDFTADELFTFTGRMKQTTRRRSGGVTHVTLTRWGDLQKTIGRTQAAERQRRSRHKTMRDDQRDIRVTDKDLDLDHDQDHHLDSQPTGLAVAIEEARKDSDVLNAVKVGKHRYELDPTHYNRLAAHATCRKCWGKAKILGPYAPGGQGNMIACPGEELGPDIRISNGDASQFERR